MNWEEYVNIFCQIQILCLLTWTGPKGICEETDKLKMKLSQSAADIIFLLQQRNDTFPVRIRGTRRNSDIQFQL
jgi:hypothetical protein